MISIELKGHVRWGDADAAGRLHFPRIFEYFEDAEAALLKSVGFNATSQRREYDFPRVHVECQFRTVLALYAPFWMVVTVGQLGRSSIRYDYRVFADEAKTVVACEGSMTVVAVKDGKAMEMPRELRDALGG